MNERGEGTYFPQEGVETKDISEIVKTNLADLLSERFPVERVTGNLFTNDDRLGDVISGVHANDVVCDASRVGVVVGTGCVCYPVCRKSQRKLSSVSTKIRRLDSG